LIAERSPLPKNISKAGMIQVYQRTAQQELVAEAPTTGLEARGRTQEALSGSERINEGQGGQKETSHPSPHPQKSRHGVARSKPKYKQMVTSRRQTSKTHCAVLSEFETTPVL
jgi:hypothetical protein